MRGQAASQAAWQGRGEIFANGSVTLRDVTRRHRFGCKGAQAAAFLQDLGVAVPERFNHWTGSPEGLLVARLAATEFFLESAPPLPQAHRVQVALAEARAAARPGIYPVLREDAAFEIEGPLANDLLVQVCNVDFRPVVAACTPAGGALVMTSLAGVAVLAVPLPRPAAGSAAESTMGSATASALGSATASVTASASASGAALASTPRAAGGVALRIWCDPTLGRWLWATLLQIAEELGDGGIESNGGWT